jgi:hypothetical protein
MFLLVLACYGLVALCWPITASISRRPKSGSLIIGLAILLPFVFVAMEFLMAMFGGGGGTSDENFSGVADYMPTVLLIAYIAASIALIIWSHLAESVPGAHGIPVVTAESVSGDDSDAV